MCIARGKGGPAPCNYTYDDLARVATSNCGTTIWNQQFGYDAMGNITKTVPTGSTGTSFQPTYDITKNRITSAPFTYDSNNGNLTADGNHNYTWDPEGRMISVDSGGSSAICLTYDAFGRMVEQTRGSGTCPGVFTASFQQIVYSPTGGKFALMNGQTLVKAFVPLPAGATALYNASGIQYYRHPDHLGTSRLATTPSRTKYYDVAYAPFGESYNGSGTTDLSFTGQNQDTVSGGANGLYDFLYREHAPVQGRWLSPDPAGMAAANPADPQTWNRYAYVRNNPNSAIDPLGMRMCVDDPCSPFYDGGGGGGGDSGGSSDDPGIDSFAFWDSMIFGDAGFGGFSVDGWGLCGESVGLPCGLGPLSTNPGLPCDFGYCGPQFGTGMGFHNDENGWIVGDYPGEMLCPPGWPCTTWNPLIQMWDAANTATISAAKPQPPPKPASWWSKYTTQLSCEFSVFIADLSDQLDYFKGSGTVLAAGLAGNSLTLGLAGDALVGAALIGDAFHARSICVPLAWGK